MSDSSSFQQAVRRDFAQAAARYERHATLQCAVAKGLVGEMATHLQDSGAHGRWLDAGCGTGFLAQMLAEQPWALAMEVLQLDSAEAMLHQARPHAPLCVAGDMTQLPLGDNSVSGIVSSLSMQWLKGEALAKGFVEMQRVLQKDGWLFVTSLGPQTLQELRGAFEAAGKAAPLLSFQETGKIAADAQKAGLEVVSCASRVRHEPFASPLALMQHLKYIGASAKESDQPKGLLTPRALKTVWQHYPNAHTGRITASFEVVTLVGRG